MQTLILDHKKSAKGMSHILADRTPMTQPVAAPWIAPPASSAAKAEPAQTAAYAELDAMLREDPSFGAVHGLRVALLFNAGLALSGLVAWEIWTLLAH